MPSLYSQDELLALIRLLLRLTSCREGPSQALGKLLENLLELWNENGESLPEDIVSANLACFCRQD